MIWYQYFGIKENIYHEGLVIIEENQKQHQL